MLILSQFGQAEGESKNWEDGTKKSEKTDYIENLKQN